MKQILFVLFVLFGSAGMLFSQGKVKNADNFIFNKKAGTVTDKAGNTLFFIDYVPSVTTALAHDYYFKNSAGKNLVVFKYISYRDIRLIAPNNNTGTQMYYEIKFFSEPILESECRYMYLKELVSMVYQKGFIDNGALDIQKVNEFVTINGNTFSRRRAELSGVY